MGYDTPMAISNYLAVLIAIILIYPFALVAVNIAIYSPVRRKKVTKWFNIVSFLFAAIVFALHMQTEVTYGKDLLDKYYRDNPQALEESQKGSDETTDVTTL
ncbi:hypothetical protein L1D13_13295 [Vibrio tubiashii]|uniref:hypothetical protein n=1 Tax=Vibrio tubiashii TaxID=29498 RepID=UPI001EFC9D99|nr:hypothetical protein [Vibrio tubiashii]MCG9582426.1 hypothetical protein [Vibrio tubiashii]MCG9616017.1 hypothetical protein [Vibrio tubiashii]MCG9687895.1 hypothetical protein [Vibrio tubiashii]